jgi:hypothetical protein
MGPVANISVAANIWADVQHPERDPGPYAAAEHVPGDLLVNILRERDTRVLPLKLTRQQYREYLRCRFFYPHGHTGYAYEGR